MKLLMAMEWEKQSPLQQDLQRAEQAQTAMARELLTETVMLPKMGIQQERVLLLVQIVWQKQEQVLQELEVRVLQEQQLFQEHQVTALLHLLSPVVHQAVQGSQDLQMPGMEQDLQVVRPQETMVQAAAHPEAQVLQEHQMERLAEPEAKLQEAQVVLEVKL
jgi:hypothetical protein